MFQCSKWNQRLEPKSKMIELDFFCGFFREIYQYLDEVDFNCDRTIHNMKWQKEPETYAADINFDYLIEQDVVGDVPK